MKAAFPTSFSDMKREAGELPTLSFMLRDVEKPVRRVYPPWNSTTAPWLTLVGSGNA